MIRPLVVLAAVVLSAAYVGIPDGWERRTTADIEAQLPSGYEDWGYISQFDVPIFDAAAATGQVVGRTRRGQRLPVRPAATKRACVGEERKGQWLESPNGYICSASGIVVGRSAASLVPRFRPVDPDKPLPFNYVKVTEAGVWRHDRPSIAARARVESQTKAFFLAVDQRVSEGGADWIRTVKGEYVLARFTRRVSPPTLRGVDLAGRREPIAFVVGQEPMVPVFCRRDGAAAKCGTTPRFTPFRPAGRVRVGGRSFVRDSSGRLHPQERVRVARMTRRPATVPSGARWVHFDLDEQTFVAYEGSSPRYASLISSGAKGYETPVGLYRTQRKYLTKTMRGPDDKHGRYRVEEIPWVLYYDGNYAVHGAYWHSSFGNVRSHGCTNVSPVDAQWLFRWDEASVPSGWHANTDVESGLYFYFTRSESA